MDTYYIKLEHERDGESVGTLYAEITEEEYIRIVHIVLNEESEE